MLGPNDIYIVDRLARGGMAEVFLGVVATQRGDAWVVAKRVLPEFSTDNVYRQLFEQERTIVSALNHSHVVRSVASLEGDEPILLMEYIDGTSLYELLIHAKEQDIVVPVHVAAFLLSQACHGAHAAHELRDAKGHHMEVLHRDLTPHNLMVSASGKLRIIDFGIATTGATRTLQHQRSVKGKTHYLSPECALQKSQDRRSDIFTLGVVGCELLTGERPAREHPTMAYPLPLRLGREDVPSAFREALERAIAHDPDERWHTAAELNDAIAPLWSTDRERAQRDTAALIHRLVGDVLSARREHYRSMKSRPRIPLTALKGQPWETVQSSIRGTAIRDQRQREIRQRFVVAFAVTTVALFGSALVESNPNNDAMDDMAPSLRIATTMQQDLPLHVGMPSSFQWLESKVNADRPIAANDIAYDALLFPGDRAYPAGWHPIASAEINGQTSRTEHLIASVASIASRDATARTLCFSGARGTIDEAVAQYQRLDHGTSKELRIDQMSDPQRVLRATLTGACSAGVVAGNTYATAPLNGIQTDTLRVLSTTRVRQTPVVLVHETLPTDKREQLRQGLEAMEPEAHNTSRMDEGITGFALTADSVLDAPL